ncbi:pyridoxal phosphate-dependent aminotransferase [Rubeoparvulum massiliense]|uniref:pyridoxal phosphate-dependent aminotransferase n=1 Tax=Rubeoparvulum massiliense TaxID=1631346 RepID=UPI00065E0577|nr:pyridoxal phosphate-dependent aminotransferase [Rubeoparvulum massiliense]
MKLSQRVQHLKPSATINIAAKAKQMVANGEHLISFGVGEPDFPTPPHVIDACIEALQSGKTTYTAAGGIRELKEAITRKFDRENGLTYSPDQITIGMGAKHMLYTLFQAILDPGDELIVLEPYWVSYPEMIKLAGGVPVIISCREENQFRISINDLRHAITPKTKGIILNSPHNPTGVVYRKDELASIAKLCLENNMLIISDEIYEHFVYGTKHISIASLSEDVKKHTIIINGLSKSHAMTGWRLGYAAGDAQIIKAMGDLTGQSVSNAVTFVQYAAIAALDGDQNALKHVVAEYEARRCYMLERLGEFPGVSAVTPTGAFYIYLNVRELMGKLGYQDVAAFSEALLQEAKVVVIPGTAFGTADHIRLSYATSMQNIEEGLNRLHQFIQRSTVAHEKN